MEKPVISPLLVLVMGIFAVSISAILIRFAQAEADSLVIAAWRLTLASAILIPICAAKRRDEVLNLSRGDWTAALLSGFCLALHFATWISSIAYTSITASTVLGTTTPIWVAIASPIFLKESVPRTVQIGIVIAIVGSVISVLGGGMGEETTLFGNGLALIGGMTGGAYMLFGRALRKRVSVLTYITVVYGMAAVVLLIIAIAAGHPLFGYSPYAYLLFLLMALFPQLIGHSSFNYALGYLPVAYVTVTIICEPIASSILAVIIFREIPTLYTLIGGVLILAGVIIASLNAKG